MVAGMCSNPGPTSCMPAVYLLCSGFIALAGTLGYILSFAIGAGPVTGLIVPEINKEAVWGEPLPSALLPWRLL